MNLEKLEVRNHRSIKDQWGENAITFEGLDCLVGKNNVGKTNIVSAIKYLLEEEDKAKNEELYWNKDTSLTVEVRGYFKVLEEDLKRIEDEDKREQVQELLLNNGDLDNHLGVCRSTEPREGEDTGNTSFRVIQLRPVDEELSEDVFVEFRNDQWDRTDEEDGFTKTDYRDEMQEKYPEIADFVDEDSLKQKTAWKEGYERYLNSRPEDLEFEPKPTEFPTGTKNLIREAVLPNVIKIPAIKEVEDAAQASGELGEMTDALYSELEEDINKQLDEQLDGVYDRLDTNSESFETQISEYLKEAFRDYSVNLDFPRIESRRLFRDVGIRIRDEQLEDTLSHENVGEGMRRVLVFSMLRTIADLRDGSLAVSDGETDGDQRQPLLILYEEAELFLHPNLQKNLLRVFRNLCDSEAQIVFNTHSPVLIQNRIIDTINIVRDNSGTEVTQFHTVLEDRSAREQSRLMDLQKISSYIFSDRVVLVEGQSDEIVLKKASTILDSKWIFESQNIPILELGGKDDLPLFKEFLEELGIEVFAMGDIGALSSCIPQMVENEDLVDKINGLKGKAGEIGENGWKQPIVDDYEQLDSIREEVRVKLLEENILVLMGDIEDYYPEVEPRNKIEAALEFSATEYSPDELRTHFVNIPDKGKTDVEVFLESIFED